MRFVLVICAVLSFSLPVFAGGLPPELTTTQTKLSLSRLFKKDPKQAKAFEDTVLLSQQKGDIKTLAKRINDWAVDGKIDADSFQKTLEDYRSTVLGGADRKALTVPMDRQKDAKPKQNDYMEFAHTYKFQTEPANRLFKSLKGERDTLPLVVMGRLLHAARTIPKMKGVEDADHAKLVKRAERVMELWYVKFGQTLPKEDLENGIRTMETLIAGKDFMPNKPVTEEAVENPAQVIKGLEVLLELDSKELDRQTEALLRGELFEKKK